MCAQSCSTIFSGGNIIVSENYATINGGGMSIYGGVSGGSEFSQSRYAQGLACSVLRTFGAFALNTPLLDIQQLTLVSNFAPSFRYTQWSLGDSKQHSSYWDWRGRMCDCQQFVCPK